MCNQNLQYFRKPLRLFLKKEISLAVGDVRLPKFKWKSFNPSYSQKAFF